MSFQATVEPLDAPKPKDSFQLNFQYRVDGEAGLFRVLSEVYDDDLLVLMTHIARFPIAPLPDDANDRVVGRFIDESVMPAVFPYIQEGAASAAARVRPKRPLLITWNYNEALELGN
ncbi:hypothetical protein NLX83_17980 [Allokutzneria sp. A3M-2-11 16]|uniref:hypothetical protein n=1 Tax=Allokutzneria sp. A3M-2-11 16 TaxID=2962043 RepID=UPI0020B8D664|nr:hypothetical protein [Allokutzneria sp. A3M-2-11 16]MCP3801153.1 hypothetical protein [Allokutzneria sp. A3M-2-11 16]